MKPYADNLEHLLDELSRIDLLMQSYLENLQENFPGAGDELRGLYISEAEIEWIQRNPGFGSKQGTMPDLRIESLKEINAIRKEIDARKEESLKKGQGIETLYPFRTFWP